MKLRTVPCVLLFGLLMNAGPAAAQNTSYTATLLDFDESSPFPGGSVINASGQVVGIRNYHATIYNNGTYQDLGTLGGTLSGARAINANGDVVGYSSLSNNDQRAFLYKNGVMTNLGTLGASPGSTASTAAGINNQGQIAGYTYLTTSAYDHAFLDSNGTMHDIGTLAEPGFNSQAESQAYGINNNGQIVGKSVGAALHGGPDHAFLYQPSGSLVDLGTLGGAASQAYGINDSGNVVGFSYLSVGSNIAHSFLYTNGVMQDLGTLGQATSTDAAYAINSLNDIVGASAGDAFLYSGGHMLDINSFTITGASPGKLTLAYGINDSGWIVVKNQNQQTYLLKPSAATTPEPSTLLMAITGVVCGLGLRRARRRKANCFLH